MAVSLLQQFPTCGQAVLNSAADLAMRTSALCRAMLCLQEAKKAYHNWLVKDAEHSCIGKHAATKQHSGGQVLWQENAVAEPEHRRPAPHSSLAAVQAAGPVREQPPVPEAPGLQQRPAVAGPQPSLHEEVQPEREVETEETRVVKATGTDMQPRTTPSKRFPAAGGAAAAEAAAPRGGLSTADRQSKMREALAQHTWATGGLPAKGEKSVGGLQLWEGAPARPPKREAAAITAGAESEAADAAEGTTPTAVLPWAEGAAATAAEEAAVVVAANRAGPLLLSRVQRSTAHEGECSW